MSATSQNTMLAKILSCAKVVLRYYFIFNINRFIMKELYVGILAFCWTILPVSAQVNYTANQQVTPYTGKFRPGINMGYYPGWSNKALGDVAAGNPSLNIPGIGAKSNRVGLLEYVLDYYGYDLVVDDFQHWNDLGMGEYTAFLAGPTDFHRDMTQYCPGRSSYMFANLYTPIWDGGANDTPYNDENYCAAFFYKAVSQYKDQVRFWEIWNEPGFDFTGNLGWRDENYPGNWWLEGPNPCDNIMQAPIYNYTRTLRIAWEVIKTLDPDSYVCLGSVGYPSFLNALLRNTDNPNGGDVSPEYPLGGGAYFDCIAIHSYPHFDGSTFNPDLDFYERHSDQAADGVTKSRDDFQAVLDQYGYDGVTYPKKEWISTEINSPRKAFTGPYFAGVDAQINHMMKAQMIAKINGIHQLHPYQLFDQKTDQDAGYEFDLMGLYKKIDGITPYNQVVNDEGKALKTMTDLVFDTEYDPVQTAALNFPPGVRGYAWKRVDGSFIYSLWARTKVDGSESALATYSFPGTFNATYCVQYNWDYGYTNAFQSIAPDFIELDARPKFFTTGSGQTPCLIFAGVTDIRCDDHNTNNTLSDDTYTFKLTVGGISNSGHWIATVAGQDLSGIIGATVNLGPYPITGGNIQIAVVDADDNACTAHAIAVAPAPCSIPYVYCSSQSDYPWHEWIAGVQTGSINQTSGKSPYSDFSAQHDTIAPGNVYPIGLTSGFSWLTYDEYWRVWIDFDQDGVFEPSEVAFEGIQPAPVSGITSALFNGMLNIPASAQTGDTKMRVSMKRGEFAGPCQILPFGEVEDYSITIGGNGSGGGSGVVPYCSSQSDYPWHDWIARVQIGSLDHASVKTPYSDFTGISTDIQRGQSLSCILTSGFSWETFDEYWTIWIDYNQNGVFESPSEKVYAGLLPKPANGINFSTLNGAFTVALNAALGATRMRVSMKRGDYSTACEQFTFGEVEDYTVQILPEASIDRSQNGSSLRQFSVFPNPATDNINIDLGDFAGQEGLLLVYNASGRRMAEVMLAPKTPARLNISSAAWPGGPYVVQIHTNRKNPVAQVLLVKG